MKKFFLGALMMVPLIVLPLIAQEYSSGSAGDGYTECAAVELYTTARNTRTKAKKLKKALKCQQGGLCWEEVAAAAIPP